MTWIRVKNEVEPSTPPSGRTELYVDSVSKRLCGKDDNGVVTDYSAIIDPYLSAGIYTLPTITEVDGIITIGNNGTYNLFSNSDGSGVIQNHSINGGDFIPGAGTLSYIIANYNSGNPIIEMITDVSLINETTIIPIVTVYCDGIRCHVLDWDNLGKALTNKIHQSIVKTTRYRRESGLTLSETGTRNIIITSGIVWVGANKQTPSSINTTIDNIEFYYNVGGVWTSSIVNQYNNTQYDNGTNLVTLNNNKYAVNYIYRSVDNHKDVYIILGSGDYTLPEALSAQPRIPPSVVQNTAILVGRIIVLKSASTATQIDSAFVTQFTSSGIQNHNDLSGIQGGTDAEYYHLSNNQASNLPLTNTTNIFTSLQKFSDNIVLPKTSGYGIKLDTSSPTFGWRDLVSDIIVRDTTNPVNPSYNKFRGGLRNYQFSVNDECFVMFHIPHDYVPGTDIYIHCHWAHASTTVTSGSVTWSFEVIYAKGHNQAAFSAPITTSVSQNASTTQYQHMIAEVQLSAASPSGSQLNTSLIEVDGLLEARVYLSANTMNGTPEPYLKYVDIHYQSTNMPTKNKAPNFYT